MSKEVNLEGSKLEKTFHDLPPRVVIHDILSFHVAYSSEFKKEFDLYGYFKLDRSRHAWHLFSCVEIGDKRSNLCVNLQRLIYLKISTQSTQLYKRLVAESSNMFRLQNLTIHVYASQPRRSVADSLKDMIHESSFPSLDKLELYCSSGEESLFKVDTSKWVNAKDLWSRLSWLEIKIPGFNNINLVRSDGFLTNLKKLVLDGVHFPEEVIISIPNLTEIDLDECTNLKFKTGNKLTDIRASDIHPSVIHDFLVLYPENLKSLAILFNDMNMNYSDLKWLRHYIGLVKKKVELDGIANIIGPLNFSSTLEELEVYTCTDFDGTILETEELTGLKELSLRRITNHDNVQPVISTNWKFTKSLTKVYINLESLDDSVFIELDWDNLEDIDIGGITFRGVQWNKMPKVTSLRIRGYRMLNGDGLVENVFPKLPLLERYEMLQYYRMNQGEIDPDKNQCHELFTNLGSKNLKIVRLRNSINLTDKSFIETDWSELKRLSITKIPLLTGKMWKMWNMTDLRVDHCDSFCDDMFRYSDSVDPKNDGNGNCLSKISTLDLNELPNVYGTNWNFTNPETLTTIYLYNMTNMTEEIFINNHFSQLDSLVIHKCPKIQGQKWNLFPKLETLNIEDQPSFDIDNFLNEHEELFDILENLEINACKLFTGKSEIFNEEERRVRVFSKLEDLSIVNCDSFDGDFFIHFRFPTLNDLELEKLDLLTGERVHLWNHMKNLEKLSLDQCKEFGDDLFVHGKPIETVRTLDIESCSKVTGWGWTFFPFLHHFVYCGKLDPRFLENKPFSESCTFEYDMESDSDSDSSEDNDNDHSTRGFTSSRFIPL